MPKRGLNLPKKRTVEAPASLLSRFAAYAADILIIYYLIARPFSKITKQLLPNSDFREAYAYLQSNPEAANVLLLSTLSMGILILIYFTYFEFKLQQTPGKMILRQYIKPVKGKLTFWNYLISNLTFLPFFPFVILWVVDPIYMIFSKDNQRLMEKVTRILVVQKYEV